MKRFNFPFAYEPKLNFKNTIVYSGKLKQLIFDYLINKYKCIYIDPGMIVGNNKSSIAYFFGDRLLTFDNKSNNSIFAINSVQDNYLLLLGKKLKNENFFTFAPYLRRDASQTNLDSVISWGIDVELSMPINLNMDYFSNLARDTYFALANIASHNELKKIYAGSNKKIHTKTFSIIDSQKLENMYPTLSLEEAFTHYCSQHKFVIVQNNLKKLKSGRTLEDYVSTAHDSRLSCGLYVYDEINSKPLLLINICKRPDGQTSKDQLLESNPQELTNELYDSEIFDLDKPTNISLLIHFTNLLFFFLDKVHLSEVVKSVWPDEFMDFIKKEKIEIF